MHAEETRALETKLQKQSPNLELEKKKSAFIMQHFLKTQVQVCLNTESLRKYFRGLF